MSEEREEALPTAAYEWRYEDWEKGHTTLRHNKPENNFDVELSLEHELVRRKDVKALIQDKMNKALSGSTDIQYIEKKVKELLDEVQNDE